TWCSAAKPARKKPRRSRATSPGCRGCRTWRAAWSRPISRRPDGVRRGISRRQRPDALPSALELVGQVWPGDEYPSLALLVLLQQFGGDEAEQIGSRRVVGNIVSTLMHGDGEVLARVLQGVKEHCALSVVEQACEPAARLQ